MGLLDLGEIMGAARRAHGLAGFAGPPYSTTALLEACAPDVLVTGSDELPYNITEMVTVKGAVRTLIYNRRVNTGAQRVGIAHGLGHLHFDLSEGILELGCSVRFNAERPPRAPVEERGADLFAGELLVPLHELDERVGIDLFPSDPAGKQAFHDHVDQCASLYKVPSGFIRWRLWDLLHLRRSNFYLP